MVAHREKCVGADDGFTLMTHKVIESLAAHAFPVGSFHARIIEYVAVDVDLSQDDVAASRREGDARGPWRHACHIGGLAGIAPDLHIEERRIAFVDKNPAPAVSHVEFYFMRSADLERRQGPRCRDFRNSKEFRELADILWEQINL